jgi:acyl-CoA thioesterase II
MASDIATPTACHLERPHHHFFQACYNRIIDPKMTQAGPRSLTEQLAFKPQSNDNEFEAIHMPQQMGNPNNIAYGGYALATACKSAYLSVPSGYHLYSLLGHYLGPAYCDRPLRAKVRTVRQTRTFATRQVEVSQKTDDGKERVCLIALADFQVKEPATLLEFSRPPASTYTHYKDLPTEKECFQKLCDDGKISAKTLAAHTKTFGPMGAIFDQRPCPESIFAQNLFGIAKTLPTTQDHLPLTDRTSADWFRCREAIPTPADQLANLAFVIDSAIAFLPLGFSHLWFEDVAACSSLEFALRVFRNGDDVDLGQWHLRELSTKVGAEGRSYGESWVWDEAGRAVACMSQQSILRPPPGGGKKRENGKL